MLCCVVLSWRILCHIKFAPLTYIPFVSETVGALDNDIYGLEEITIKPVQKKQRKANGEEYETPVAGGPDYEATRDPNLYSDVGERDPNLYSDLDERAYLDMDANPLYQFAEDDQMEPTYALATHLDGSEKHKRKAVKKLGGGDDDPTYDMGYSGLAGDDAETDEPTYDMGEQEPTYDMGLHGDGDDDDDPAYDISSGGGFRGKHRGAHAGDDEPTYDISDAMEEAPYMMASGQGKKAPSALVSRRKSKGGKVRTGARRPNAVEAT